MMNWPFFNKKKHSAPSRAKPRNSTAPSKHTKPRNNTAPSNRTQQRNNATSNDRAQQPNNVTPIDRAQQPNNVTPIDRAQQPSNATPIDRATLNNKVLPCNSVLSSVHARLDEISGRLSKMELRQQEAALQLDEIADVLQDVLQDAQREDDAAVRPLLEALMALSAQIENFYRFVANDGDSPLFTQAQMMWRAAKAAGDTADFERIDDAHVPFDVKRHETESSERDDSLPGGYVLRTLKCGYTYKGEVIRRSAVVVNKPSLTEVNR